MSQRRSGGPARDEDERRVNLVRKGSTQRTDHDAELAEILSVAAHELRTPATVILGLAATLAANRGRMAEDQVEEAIVRLDRQANRLVGLLEDRLDVSAIHSRPLPVLMPSADLPHR